MAKCKICGSRIADGATKCPTCGSPVGATAESLQSKPHVGGSSTSTAAGLGVNVTNRTSATTGRTGAATGTGSTAKASTTSGTGSTSGIGTTTGIGHTTWTGATTGSGTTATPTPAPVILSPEEKKKKTERMVNSICAIIGVLFLVTCWIVGTILNRGSESTSTTSRSSTSSSTSASSYSSSSPSSSYTNNESVIFCLKIGSYSRYEFINIIGTNAFAEGMYSSFREKVEHNNFRVEKFFSIDENSADKEAMDVVNSIPSYITSKYSVSDGSTFYTGVQRNENSSNIDGWFVVSNYTTVQGWFHYLYYFHAVAH